MTPVIALLIIALAAAGIAFYKRPLKKVRLPDGYKDLLTQHVWFYRALDEAGKIRFENKLKEFLGYIRITGVDTQVEDLDTLLVASSAIIPIFGFPEWRYYNLRPVAIIAIIYGPPGTHPAPNPGYIYTNPGLLCFKA